jgi:nucleoside-diphosphate-sugar epimerase
MKCVAITGANGVVGNLLRSKLEQDYEIVNIDLPEVDVRNSMQLAKALKGADTVIHLAGIFGPSSEGKENYLSPHQDPVNLVLFRNTLQASLRATVRQFIHASSVHIEDSFGYSASFPDTTSELLVARPGIFSTPSVTGYGNTKRLQEAELETFSSLFPDGAVSLRFGGIRTNNRPPSEEEVEPITIHERRTWLENGDLTRLMTAVLEQPSPGYQTMYAVSDNYERFHDISNNFGWEPQAGYWPRGV